MTEKFITSLPTVPQRKGLFVAFTERKRFINWLHNHAFEALESFLKENGIPMVRRKYTRQDIAQAIYDYQTKEEWLLKQKEIEKNIDLDFEKTFAKCSDYTLQDWIKTNPYYTSKKELLTYKDEIISIEIKKRCESMKSWQTEGLKRFLKLHPDASNDEIFANEDYIIELEQSYWHGIRANSWVSEQTWHLKNSKIFNNEWDAKYPLHFDKEITIEYYDHQSDSIKVVLVPLRLYAKEIIAESSFKKETIIPKERIKKAKDRILEIEEYLEHNYSQDYTSTITNSFKGIGHIIDCYEFKPLNSNYSWNIFERRPIFTLISNYIQHSSKVEKSVIRLLKNPFPLEVRTCPICFASTYCILTDQEFKAYQDAKVKKENRLSTHKNNDAEQSRQEYSNASYQVPYSENYFESSTPCVDYVTNINIAHSDRYPTYGVPSLNKPIFPHRRSEHQRRKGYMEDKFSQHLKTLLPTELVYNDATLRLFSDGTSIEPDIAVISDRNKHLRIDIEIDEPYAGYNHEPIHFIDSGDILRDELLVNAGWSTIRFAEEQIVKTPYSCIQKIAEYICSADPMIQIDLSTIKKKVIEQNEAFTEIPRWTREEAIRMANEDYRERYLGIDKFGYTPDNPYTQPVEENVLEEFFSTSSKENVVKQVTRQLETREREISTESHSESTLSPIEREFALSIHNVPVHKAQNIKSVAGEEMYIEDYLARFFKSLNNPINDKIREQQRHLYRELCSCYQYKNECTYSRGLSLVKKYLDDNNLKLEQAGKEIHYKNDKVNIYFFLGGIIENTLYEFQLERKAILTAEPTYGCGCTNTLFDVDTNHYRVIASLKSVIIKEVLGIDIQNVKLVRLKSNGLYSCQSLVRDFKVAEEMLHNKKQLYGQIDET